MPARAVLCALAATLLLLLAAPAQPQEPPAHGVTYYLGVYAGASYWPDTDIDIAEERFEDRQFDLDRMVGARFGWWWRELPFLALEFNLWNSWTGTDFRDFDIVLVNVSGSFLLQHFFGPLRAYGGGGIIGTWAELTNSADDETISPGAIAQAGAEYIVPIAPEWGIFTEFRFTWNAFMFEDDGMGKVDINPSRMEFLAGVAYHF